MTEQEFLRKMQDDVLVTEDPVTMDLRLDASDLWDSLSIVGFIAMAKMTAGKKIGRQKLETVKTVRDLYQMLQ